MDYSGVSCGKAGDNWPGVDRPHPQLLFFFILEADMDTRESTAQQKYGIGTESQDYVSALLFSSRENDKSRDKKKGGSTTVAAVIKDRILWAMEDPEMCMDFRCVC